MKYFSPLLFLLLMCSLCLAHGPRTHVSKSEAESDLSSDMPEVINERVLNEINKNYLKNVKPIFQTKCFDCHSRGNPLPWYAAIPGPRQLILQDIEEGLEHLDMSKDFPFAGHGNAREDLEEILEVLEEGSMPPFRYKAMHWSSGLTDDEKRQIEEWIQDSLSLDI